MANVKVRMNSHGQGEVYLDGEEIKGVSKISLAAGVNSMNLVTLEILADKVTVEGPFKVQANCTGIADTSVRHFSIT